jgi:dimethylargininase
VALPADDDRPDAVFVQDRAAVIDGRAIVGPSAVAERRGEAEPIVAVLQKSFPVVTLRAPACLDWGDVLVTEEALFVGLSERSNEAAVRQLREMLAPGRMVESVPLPTDLLHLLSGCAYLGGGDLLAVASLSDFGTARGFSVVPVPQAEALCANVLSFGREVIAPAGYPETAASLEATGRRVHTVPVGEFEKRDGGVTCLSILY